MKPLFVSREFLVDKSPTGECLRSFVNELRKNAWNPKVYCSDIQPQKNNRVLINEKIVHESIFPKYLAAAIRRLLIPDLTWLPGYEWWSWGKRCKNQILQDIRNGERFDYLHTVSFPCACHTVGLKIKCETNLPWIAQFYDPWADNPYRPFKTAFFKKIDWELEREVAENADLIIHTNEPIAQLWRERYGDSIAKKIVVLPLTASLPSVPVVEPKHKDDELLTISHIGNFMLNRTSIPFIKAVLMLFKEYPYVKTKLKINYIGQVTDKEKELIRNYGLADNFNLTGPIPPEECEPFYQQTDVFLAIDGVNKNNIFFPSKILKYFYYQKPILGITPTGSVLDEELRTAGHAVFNNEDVNSIKEYLYKLVTDYSSIAYDRDYWKRFTPITVVNEYYSLVNNKLFKSK
ncbi:glycosyltransferase [uncultured Prevotella sp.]|uniref:glycosyltransferase n=1 Tax=uncultured Prevotella sp. TaxID=159272 RepID=UPI0025FBADDD|nr:glycosyltransferase [uncultured Prevotella sp.]